jgi:hypothetical protein
LFVESLINNLFEVLNVLIAWIKVVQLITCLIAAVCFSSKKYPAYSISNTTMKDYQLIKHIYLMPWILDWRLPYITEHNHLILRNQQYSSSNLNGNHSGAFEDAIIYLHLQVPSSIVDMYQSHVAHNIDIHSYQHYPIDIFIF